MRLIPYSMGLSLRTTNGSKILQHVVDLFDLALNVLVIILPEIRVAKTAHVEALFLQLGGSQIEERLYGHQGITNVMTQSSRQQSQTNDPVGDHHVVQHR